MANDWTERDEFLKVIDETPADLRASFEEYFNDVSIDDFKGAVENIPLLAGLPVEAFRPILKEILNLFWKELEIEITAFCEFWKNQVPPDEVLSKMSDPEHEALVDSFESDIERVFQEFMKKFQVKFNLKSKGE